MTQRRRQTKREARPWAATIVVSAVVHIAVIAGLIALGWRAIEISEPGSAISVHIVLDAAGPSDSANSASLLRATAKPRLAVAGSPIGSLLAGGPTESSQVPGDAVRLRQWDPSPHHPPSSEQNRNESAHTEFTKDTSSSAKAGDGSGAGAGDSSDGGGQGNPILAEIRRRIERAKRYPLQAREQHIEGRVGLRFSIQPDGGLRDLHVTQSSGNAVLDQAALQAVQHSTPLPRFARPIDISLAFRLR